jgi:hypothetical protein
MTQPLTNRLLRIALMTAFGSGGIAQAVNLNLPVNVNIPGSSSSGVSFTTTRAYAPTDLITFTITGQIGIGVLGGPGSPSQLVNGAGTFTAGAPGDCFKVGDSIRPDTCVGALLIGNSTIGWFPMVAHNAGNSTTSVGRQAAALSAIFGGLTIPSGTQLIMKVNDSVHGDNTGSFALTGCSYSGYDPNGYGTPGTGGTFTIPITTQTGCPWTSSTTTPWMTVNQPGGIGSGQISFTTTPNNTGAHRNGFIVINGQNVPIASFSQCTFSFPFTPPGPVGVPAAGGSGSVLLQTQAGCVWTASSTVPWAPLAAGNSNGTGQSQVLFNFQANNTGATRTGNVTIAGTTITFSQPSVPPMTLSCSPNSGPTKVGLAYTTTCTVGGGIGPYSFGSFPVNSLLPGLTAVQNGPNTLLVTGAPTQAGAYSFGFFGQDSQTPKQSKTVTFTGTIAPECSYSLNPSSISVPATTGSSGTTVTAPNGCAWTATSNAAWISVVSGANGSGNGPVAFNFQANPNESQRSGTLTIGGQTFTVSQAGLSCNYTVSPLTMSAPPSGTTGTSTVTAPNGCNWTAVSNTPWITIVNGHNGSGSGAVNFSVSANPDPTQRTGTATVAGQTVNFAQAGSVANCTYILSQTSVTVPASGGSDNVAVNNTAGSSCNWTVSNTANWIIITVGAGGGTGSGNVAFTAQPNSSTTQRSAQLIIAGLTLTVTQPGVSGPAPLTSGLKFVPLTPCRLVDTRALYAAPRTGAFGAPTLTAGSTRTIPVPTSSTCSVPQTAKAYVFNVTLDTIENQTGPVDFVTVFPTGEARPDFWTARTTTGGYIANAAIVKAGVNGSVDVYTSNNVNFILDINGYFTDDVNTPGLLYYPLQPCRAVDTRGPTYSALPPPYGNQRLAAQETRTLRLPGSPACQLPIAQAYSTQLTLAPGELTNGSPVAYLTAWPSGVARPNISNMNAFFGFAVANSGIIPASSNGSIDVFALDSTNLIVDVNGYFGPDDGTGRGLLYFPTTQCRVMNTADPTQSGSFGGPAMSAGADRTIPVPSGRCSGLPTTAKAWAANAIVVPNGNSVAYLSMWPSGTAWPNISQLNAFQGQTVANSGIVPASPSGSIDVRVAGATQVAVEIAGYFAR